MSPMSRLAIGYGMASAPCLHPLWFVCFVKNNIVFCASFNESIIINYLIVLYDSHGDKHYDVHIS